MMVAQRVPAPDGAMGPDEQPLRVLPAATVVTKGRTVRYVLDYLAAGGMSVAYRATRNDGRVFLAKEVPTADTRAMVALTQEKGLLERLEHPGIIKVHDQVEQDGFVYLMLDFVDGASLEAQVGGSAAPSEAAVRSWGAELCDIFDYLHNLRPPVIYRDLKPKNVILAKDGKLHLIDFGIARLYKEGKEQDTELLGSALTASPEHYGGQTDARSDVYTLGATMHYLLSNGVIDRGSPFDFPPIRTINPEVSEEMEQILSRCLQRKARERYQTASELRDALRGRSAALVTAAPSPGRAAWVAAAASVAAVGLAAAYALHPAPLPPESPTPSPAMVMVIPTMSETPATVTATPVPERPHPRPSLAVRPLRPRPHPKRVVHKEPVVVVHVPPRLPGTDYPTRTETPSPVHHSYHRHDGGTALEPLALLRQLGNPWSAAQRARALDASDYRESGTLVGAEGMFHFPLPPGWRVAGVDGSDDALLMMSGGRRRARGVVEVHTIPGWAYDIQALTAARLQMLSSHELRGTLVESRPTTVGGKLASAVVMEQRSVRQARRSQQMREIFYAHKQPDFTLILEATAPAADLDDFLAQVDHMLQGWTP